MLRNVPETFKNYIEKSREKLRKISRNISDIFVKYAKNFREILPEKIPSNITENFERYFKNLENYSGNCWKLFRKILRIMSDNFENPFKKLQ